jgi:N-acetylmuramoyl-L-alanine amidase
MPILAADPRRARPRAPRGERAALRGTLAALAVLLAACGHPPQRAGIPTAWRPSPNHDERSVSLVVLHYTADESAAVSLHTLTSPAARVSAHYLVERDGTIDQLVDERLRAWHAGESRWGPIDDVNSASIGIELDNDGRSPYPPAQIDALLRLLADLRDRHALAPASVVGHADVAPARKADPGPWFPWRTLAQHGFGLWCDPPFGPAPPGFDALLGLRALGYDTRDASAALRAFRLHHVPAQADDAQAERDRDLIACLLAGAGVP